MYGSERGNKSVSEEDLSIAVAKALNSDENILKQKHVRTCIVFTWDHKTTEPFFVQLKTQPIYTNEVLLLKTIVLLLKILRQGHPSALRQGVNQLNFISSFKNSTSLHLYKRLVEEYSDYISTKINFHSTHSTFNGTFEYKKVSYNTLDECYETVNDLIKLNTQLPKIQKTILSVFLHSELCIASLVPLIEESFSIYQFIYSLLVELHEKVDLHDALQILRSQFNTQHCALYRFYEECRKIRYLTTLISIPTLSPDPPTFAKNSTSHRKITPPTELNQQQIITLIEQHEHELTLEPYMQQQQQQMIEQHQVQQQQLQNAEITLQQMRDYLSAEIYKRDYRINELENECLGYRQQLNQIQYNLQQFTENKQNEQNLLCEQLAATKTKHDSLSKMYSELRSEHLKKLQNSQSDQNSEVLLGSIIHGCCKRIQTSINEFDSIHCTLVPSFDKNAMDNLANQMSNAFSTQNVVQFYSLTNDYLLQFLSLRSNDSGEEIKLILKKLFDAFRSKQFFTLDSLHSDLLKLLSVTQTSHDIADIVENELLRITQSIQMLSDKLSSLIHSAPSVDSVGHSTLLDSSLSITNAIAHLIQCATLCQNEIVINSKGSLSKSNFYKKHNTWTEGLISAAKSVAVATRVLVDTADAVIAGTKSSDELLIAARQVNAATMQLVAASRVKSGSVNVPAVAKLQEKLELAAKVVSDGTKLLTKAAQEVSADKDRKFEQDLQKLQDLSLHELKVEEMNQQVKILSLEKELEGARQGLTRIRKKAYQDS